MDNLCPSGWHVPSDEEWKKLESCLCMSQTERDALGSRGTYQGSQIAGNGTLWINGDLEAGEYFGATGFMALPAGYVSSEGFFYDLGAGARFWTSTEVDYSQALFRYLRNTESTLGRQISEKGHGRSVRCINSTTSGNGDVAGYYPFNGNTNDASGNGNHATLHGATVTTDRCNIPNSAYYFDGYNDYIELPTSMTINTDYSFTIEAWIKNERITTDGKYTDNAIFGQTDGYVGNDYPIILFHVIDNNTVRAAIRGSSNPGLDIKTQDEIENDTWYHVVMVRNSIENSLKIYINGDLVAENEAIIPGNTASNDFMAIGGYIDDLQAVYHYFCGKIDDVRIYNRALCDEEIKDLSIYDCYDVLLSGENNVCQGDQQIIYRATSDANITEYTWQYSGTGAIISGNSELVSIDFSETATSGILTLSVSGDGLTPKSFEFPITINPLPFAAGSISGESNVCQDTARYFYSVPEIGHSTEYQWHYSGMGASFSGNSESIYINFTPSATSGILTVRGFNACGAGKTSTEMKIDVKLCNDTSSQSTFLLNIPNSFSPNGDGINDLFLIRGLPGNSTLMIFDRQGKKVYKTVNYEHNWGGTDDEGHLLETGTYWYIIIVPGFSQSFKGFVYLKR